MTLRAQPPRSWTDASTHGRYFVPTPSPLPRTTPACPAQCLSRRRTACAPSGVCSTTTCAMPGSLPSCWAFLALKLPSFSAISAAIVRQGEEREERGIMKFLLTSAGIKNKSIHNALVDLLGKPIAECSALCIPTAILPFPGGPQMAYRFISGSTANPMCELGWKSLGVLELTALPSIKAEAWTAAVQAADALLVQGGDVLYLCRWMRESGLADLLPSLRETVMVGVSAVSLVTAHYFE